LNHPVNAPESACASISADTLFDGQLRCYQYIKGYRFSIDAVLLAHFHQVKKADTILDIGCGCGIISLLLAYRHHRNLEKIVGLEIQPELVKLAKRNSSINGYNHLIKTIQGDLRKIPQIFQPESFSSVICNPPFYKSSSGRKNLNNQQRIARHQIKANLDDIVLYSGYSVVNRGSLSIIYPAEFMAELIESLLRVRLQPKKLQLVYSYPSKTIPARLVLIEAVKNGGTGMFVKPPFYIYQEKEGDYSTELENLYSSEES